MSSESTTTTTEAETTTTERETTTTERPTTTTTTIPRATLLTEIDAAVREACETAWTLGLPPAVDYDNRWRPAGTEAEVNDLAVKCLADREAAEIANAAPVNVDEIVKNPDAVAGQVFILVVNITQFDGATGPCGFRAYWDSDAREYNYEYAGDNAVFTGGDGVSSCPVLDGIDQNDTVRVWAKSEGTLTYDTQIGGSTTVPSFKVLKSEIIAKE